MSVKPKILFLNPPGKKIYIRDYYCSKVSKAYYLPQPVDLLVQTSYFDEALFELKVLDAIAEQKKLNETLEEVISFSPSLIIAQFGSVSYEEDSSFFSRIKAALPETNILCSGDLLLEDPQMFLDKHEWLEGAIIDFFKPAALQFLNNTGQPIDGLVYRQQLSAGEKQKYRKQTRLNVPRHDLFKNEYYRMPFMSGAPMATVLTNYACPYPCTFCIMSHLEFKSRTVDDTIEELKRLKKLGIKFIYFSDQTFYTVPKITDPILDYMIEADLGIDWMCFSRVDVTTEERLDKMKKAGCKVIMYGVEWAEDSYLQQYKKQYTTQQVRDTFKLARSKGIKLVGTFLMGVPGQTRESIINTVDFAKEIKADYASFNIAVPRVQTSFRDEALDQGLITEDDRTMDQSGSFIAMGTGELTAQEVMKLKKLAYRKFYFRPSYLLKKVLDLGNWQELKNHLNEGWYVVKLLFAR